MSSFISRLSFKNCLTHLVQWLSRPHCLLLLVYTSQALEHLLHPPHLHQFSHSTYFFFSPFTAWASILLLFKAAFIHTSFFSETLATQELEAQKKLNNNGEISLSALSSAWLPLGVLFIFFCHLQQHPRNRAAMPYIWSWVWTRCQVQTGILEQGGRKQGKFRHNWTSSKALQSQLAALSSRGLSERRDMSESETSIQTRMNFAKGQVQIGSSWTPDPDKKVPPLGLKSIWILRRSLDWPLLSRLSKIFHPVTRSWACRRRTTHFGIVCFTVQGLSSFFSDLCKGIFREGRRFSMTQWYLRNRGDKWGDPRGTSFLNSSEISNALPYL